MSQAYPLRAIVAAAAAYSVAQSTSWMQPVLLSELMTRLGASGASASLIVSAEMAALALSAALCTRLPVGSSFLAVGALATLLTAIGNALCLLSIERYAWLLTIRIATGLGEGAALMCSTALLARFANPARAYGILNVSCILLGSALLYGAPALAHPGGQTSFSALLVFVLGLLPFVLLTPRSERFRSTPWSTAPGAVRKLRWQVLAIVAVCLLCGLTSAPMWAFYFVIGQSMGLATDAINTAIACAALMSLAGSLAASIIGQKLGRTLPLALGMTLLAVAIFAVTHTHSALIYRAAMSLHLASIYFLLPYYYGFAAWVDSSGRSSGAIGAAFFFTLAIGPWLGGIMSQIAGYPTMGWVAIAATALAIALIFSAGRIHRTEITMP